MTVIDVRADANAAKAVVEAIHNNSKPCEQQEWNQDENDLRYCNHYNEAHNINVAEPDVKKGVNTCREDHFAPVTPGKVLDESPGPEVKSPVAVAPSAETQELRPFCHEETILIFDWDDTCLPSAWVQSQGLRLDEDSVLEEWQRGQLLEVANTVMETLRVAKQHGTVVLVTNAERGWIELSCQKFMPTLYPTLENIKLMSARTTYETPTVTSPLDWKLKAFESEIQRVLSSETINAPERRKNILSLGDSMHEREALLRATANMPNCRSKSLKFVERPDISQLCKQHSLITGCFERIIHHDGNLDLCIRCS